MTIQETVSKNYDWATPDRVWGIVHDVLGQFIFDPCPLGGEDGPDIPDGLGIVWGKPWYCNPPYGREIGKWTRKAVEQGGPGILLLPARTDTKWFQTLMREGRPVVVVCFLAGRLTFVGADNGAKFPSCLVLLSGVSRTIEAFENRCRHEGFILTEPDW